MGVKYTFNKQFFKKWTPEMAYALGYIYADGSLVDASYMRGKYVSITSIERENLEKIKKWLEAEHRIVSLPPLTANSKVRFLLRIGSHELYNDLLNLGLYPNKSLTMKFPPIPRAYLAHFVRGYFDGDGCVRLDMRKGVTKDMVISKLSSVFTCGSKTFLEGLALEISRATLIKHTKIYNGHRSFMLSYSTADSVELFKFMYRKASKDVYIKRKFERYKHYFILRPQRLDKKVENVLQCLS